MKRPTVNQKPRPRPSIPASISPIDKAALDRKPAAAVTGSSIDQWMNNDGYEEDPDAAEYLRKKEEKQRAWWAEKKKQKKKKNKKTEREVDWDAIYDPEQPVRLVEYKGSQEQADAAYEWKELLHAHQYARGPPSRHSSEEETRMPKSLCSPCPKHLTILIILQKPLRLLRITTLRRQYSMMSHFQQMQMRIPMANMFLRFPLNCPKLRRRTHIFVACV